MFYDFVNRYVQTKRLNAIHLKKSEVSSNSLQRPVTDSIGYSHKTVDILQVKYNGANIFSNFERVIIVLIDAHEYWALQSTCEDWRPPQSLSVW